MARQVGRYEHVYLDRNRRLRHRVIQPTYYFPICYRYNSWFTFRYFHPYYHRKYVFVSLGGYWPSHYRYTRYYWYGYHPYSWYGYYPIASEVQGDTYNYYTYNYNYDDGSATAYDQTAGYIDSVDESTFADVRARLAEQQAATPDAQTQADIYFDAAVKAFESGDYDEAAERFRQAMELSPEDMILPFAYTQALFAGEKYFEAAEALREALKNVTPEEEGVFFPRGLYPDEEVLFKQIELLSEKAEYFTFNKDLQLLLGYQLLGIGETDEALAPLQRAGVDQINRHSSTVLIDLLGKIKSNESEAEVDN